MCDKSMNDAVRTLKSSNAAFMHFCRENVENGIYVLWWAGLAQYTSMVGRLHNSGAGVSSLSHFYGPW